jgi:hypothetical protein
MPLGSSAEDEPGSGSGSNVIDPSNTSSGPIRRWVQAASYPGAGWPELSRRVLSLQVAARPVGVENQPKVQAAQAVGRTCSSSASWRMSASG